MVFELPPVTLLAMTYDWVARVLYIAINNDNLDLVILTISIDTNRRTDRKVLLPNYSAEEVELTINPFTGYELV